MDSEIVYYASSVSWDDEYIIYEEDGEWWWFGVSLPGRVSKRKVDKGILPEPWVEGNKHNLSPNHSARTVGICAECDKPVGYDYLCPDCRDGVS